jgi:cell division initiation protein
MRITPIDIQQQQFKSRPMGYDKAGVDHFLELVATELERLLRQNQDLQEELARSRNTLGEMQDRESMLKDTLLATQKVTEEMKANARREAELLLADAQMRAERLMHNAEERRLLLLDEINEIRRQRIDFESSLRSLIDKHSRMLELNTLSAGSDQSDLRLPAASAATAAMEPVGMAQPAANTPPWTDKAAVDELEFELPPGRRQGGTPLA